MNKMQGGRSRMSDSREKALGELKRLMAEQKARLDPGLLERARAAAVERVSASAAKRASDNPAQRASDNAAPAPAPPTSPQGFDGHNGLLPPPKGGKGKHDVPFDRTRARLAVELFLRRHRDRKGFERRLAELLRRDN
jgi:hypothetical protein